MASRVSFGQDNATEMKMLYSRYRKRYDLPLLELPQKERSTSYEHLI
jgi:hypothetical protein